MKKFKNIAQKLYLALILLFLYAPILVMILFSFNAGNNRSQFTGFSFQWYEAMFGNSTMLVVLGNTLILALCASAISTIIGTYSAIVIDKMTPVPKSAAMKVMNIPMLNAEIVTGIGLLLLIKFSGIPQGFFSLLIAHVTFNVPYVTLSVLPKLRQLNKSVYEAALDLGATPALAFRKITVPEILPGIASGALLAFTLSLDDFVISYFTSGADFTTLSVYIYTMTKKVVPLSINALSTVLFTVVFVLLLLVNIKPDFKAIVSKRRKQKRIKSIWKKAYEE